MSNSTRDNAIARENNSPSTKTTTEHQENVEYMELSPMLTIESNDKISNNQTISISTQSVASENNVNEKKVSNSKDKEGIFSIAKDIARDIFIFFGFILYLSDIISDLIVSGYYFSFGKYGYGCLILFFVYYGSALAAHNYRSINERTSVFLITFIFSLSGILLYKDITYILYRKWSKKEYCKKTLKERQATLRTTMYYEAMCEGYPQILIQTCIMSESIIANEHISWWRYTSVVLSTLGVIFAILRFGLNKLDTPTNRTTYDKVADFSRATFFAGVLTLVLFTFTTVAVSSGNVYFITIPFILFALTIYIFTIIFHLYDTSMSLPEFVSKEFDPQRFRTKVLQRLCQFSGIIITIICWYYIRNAILWYWPLTFNYIYYLSIVLLVLGVVAIILKIIQIVIIYVK